MSIKKFSITALIVSLWIHASETLRYFLLIIPELKTSLLPLIESGQDVAPMNLSVFLIWVIWDTLLATLLVACYWLSSERFGHTLKSIIISSAILWSFFWLLWGGVINMGLAGNKMLLLAIPLAGVEMLVAALIAQKLLSKS